MQCRFWISAARCCAALLLAAGWAATATADEPTGTINLEVKFDTDEGKVDGGELKVNADDVRATKVRAKVQEIKVDDLDHAEVDFVLKLDEGGEVKGGTLRGVLGGGGTAGVAARLRLPASGYWLGLDCTTPEPALRAQLDLPDGQGLVVRQVVEGSPAAKANLKTHDVLLTANDKPLKGIEDLVAAVESAKDEKEIRGVLFRGGKKSEFTLKAAKRPSPDRDHLIEGKAQDEIVKLFGTAKARSIRMVRPGFAFKAESMRAKLPDDLSVTIHREGKKPAKITIKKADKTYEITDEDLSKLPDDLRAIVTPLLATPLDIRPFNIKLPEPGTSGTSGEPKAGVRVELEPSRVAPLGGILPRAGIAVPAAPPESVNRRLERLERAIEELRGKRDSERPRDDDRRSDNDRREVERRIEIREVRPPAREVERRETERREVRERRIRSEL